MHDALRASLSAAAGALREAVDADADVMGPSSAAAAYGHGRSVGRGPPRSAWHDLAEIDLDEVLRTEVFTIQDVPSFFRGSLRSAFRTALRDWHASGSAASWKLFLLTPRMLLRPTA